MSQIQRSKIVEKILVDEFVVNAEIVNLGFVAFAVFKRGVVQMSLTFTDNRKNNYFRRRVDMPAQSNIKIETTNKEKHGETHNNHLKNAAAASLLANQFR